VVLSFSRPLKPDLVNLDNFQDLLQFKISDPPEGIEWALRLISMDTNSLTFLIGEKSLVEFYPGVDTKIIPSSDVKEVKRQLWSGRLLEEEEEGTKNTFASSVIQLAVSSLNQFVSNSDPPFTLFSHTISVPLLETEEEVVVVEPVACKNVTSIDQSLSLLVSERIDFSLPVYEVKHYSEKSNTCTSFTNSYPVYTLTYGVDPTNKFPQFLRYQPQEGENTPSLSIQPHSSEEVGVHVVNVDVSLQVLKAGATSWLESRIQTMRPKTIPPSSTSTSGSLRCPEFSETPGDEPYLVYLYNKQLYTLPDLKNANTNTMRLETGAPKFVSYSTSKDRFTFEANSEEQLGPYSLKLNFNVENDAYVGSHFAVSSGVSLKTFNQEFIFDIEVVDIDEGLELQRYNVPQSKEVTVFFEQEVSYESVFNSKSMQEIFAFKISNVSSCLRPDANVVRFRLKERHLFYVLSELQERIAVA